MNTYDELIDAGLHKKQTLMEELESLPDNELVEIYNWLIEVLKDRKMKDKKPGTAHRSGVAGVRRKFIIGWHLKNGYTATSIMAVSESDAIKKHFKEHPDCIRIENIYSEFESA